MQKKKEEKRQHVGKNMEKLEPLCTIGREVK